jgi:hypothetical protein
MGMIDRNSTHDPFPKRAKAFRNHAIGWILAISGAGVSHPAIIQ